MKPSSTTVYALGFQIPGKPGICHVAQSVYVVRSVLICKPVIDALAMLFCKVCGIDPSSIIEGNGMPLIVTGDELVLAADFSFDQSQQNALHWV
jgi:hypothetical protein